MTAENDKTDTKPKLEWDRMTIYRRKDGTIGACPEAEPNFISLPNISDADLFVRRAALAIPAFGKSEYDAVCADLDRAHKTLNEYANLPAIEGLEDALDHEKKHNEVHRLHEEVILKAARAYAELVKGGITPR
ncbi:MAG: hypothetical protein DI551_05630 [Micavibrio aeruginosavorus]|uniref:Uncharacterized protein n=1 Tax=Micavibrio aeruginosavorus TaxID=349221 RepID=A0A2W5N161_9BACT|nr:MAG: hypothetical protein DI551_05630 [Micavibrio aeruginosavorus]